MKTKIFKANRGEGKTKWLIDQVSNSLNSGRQIYYLGSKKTFLNFHGKCWAYGITGLHHISESIPTGEFDVFTDEFMEEFSKISKDDLAFVNECAANWYITMSAEDFVEETK